MNFAASAEEIIREKKPRLMMLHFVESDHKQHALGPSSPEIPAAMHKIDGLVSGVVEAVKGAGLYDQTTFVIFGSLIFAEGPSSART